MNNTQMDTRNPRWAFYPNALGNLFRMGHCAPTVMQTILDASEMDAEWLVKLSAGMPGGIGNTGFECGGVTSPLVMLGTRFGLEHTDHQLPVIFEKGYALCQSFLSCHHTLQCRQIRGNDHFPRHCIPPVLRSTGMFMEALDGNHNHSIPPASKEAYTQLYSHMAQNNFHCAQAVLSHLGYEREKDRELFDAASAFIGGTLFMGRTCSAFTAGVMAVGLRIGEIEDSPLRVIRLLAIMTVDGNTFDDKLNKFNHSMNLGYKLSKWFTKEFGSTQCQAVTQCDFSTQAGVDRYVEGDGITRCKQVAEAVAEKIESMLS
jgi:C_GCAxxG_C_C family probable redox protein